MRCFNFRTTVTNTVQEQQPSNLVEIPFAKLDINWKDPVGMESFGKVFKGTWLCTDVAVKQIRRGASVS